MMAFQKLRKKYSWEFRKGVIHVWFSYLFAIMLYFHCKNGSWVLIAFCIYLADVIFVAAFRTYKVEHSKFQIIGKCVKLQFRNPPTFDVDHLGYVNICVPWLDKSQWHAFSCYPSPTHPDHTELCMQVSGDWTTKLFKSLSARQSVRPVWIQGPFASPYEKSVERDNLIMVASGIGITPALSCLSALGGSRRTNLIWICRDPSLIEFFVPVVTWPESGWALIYYTGKNPLELPSDFQMPGNAKIIRGRPQLNFLIPELINSIETEDALPEDLIKTNKENSESFKMSIDDIDIAQPPVDRLRMVISRLIGTFITTEEFYTQFDTDQDHSLGASELIRGLSSFSRRLFVLSDWETSELMDSIANRTGVDQITETEFKAFVDESLYCDEDEVERQARMQSQASMRAPKRLSDHSQGWKLSCTNKRTELMHVFKEFDEDGDGTISIQELITAMGKCGKIITRQQAQVAMVNSFRGSNRRFTKTFDEGINFDQFFRLFKDVDIQCNSGLVDFFSEVKLPKSVTDRWAMLYCGGAAPVIAALNSCSEALGVKFKSESFSW
uniref:Calmodulin n=1 Tax=Octactis speculum TaxID=3111310 RepID=A0A7S2HFP6_9STRA